jgi:hypothetical protein
MNVWRPFRFDQIDERCGERWWWFPLARAGEIRLLDRMACEEVGQTPCHRVGVLHHHQMPGARSVGGKRGLLEGVMDITGPHDSTADDEELVGDGGKTPPGHRAFGQNGGVQLSDPRPDSADPRHSFDGRPTASPLPQTSGGD